MKKFRILEIKLAGGKSTFKVQNERRFLWIPFLKYWSGWYNYNNGCIYEDCNYSSFESAVLQMKNLTDDYQEYLDGKHTGRSVVREVQVVQL